MRVTFSALGVTWFDLEVTASDAEPEPDDTARDLSGGTTVATAVEAGVTDQFMGFTNGRDE